MAIAFVLAFVYLILLRCCAGILVFFTLIAVGLLLGGFGAYLYLDRDRFPEDTTYYNAMLYGGYVMFGLTAIYCLVLLCLCNRIRLGVAIIKATAQFMGNTPSVYFIPIVFFLLATIWMAAWCFSFVFLFSVGTISQRDPPL